MANSYRDAGVDVDKGYEAVERMKKHIAKTKTKEVLGDVGAFAGLFDISKHQYDEPVLVSGTDGVGTKLDLAQQFDQHETIGIDLVAMCVNDIVAQGARPLFFLDYIACGKNDPAVIEQIVAGIADGCKEAGAALIGGETAEMPGMYQETAYDLAGFTVGMAEKKHLITGESIKPSDQVIGLASSGIHSNGYSLVRKLVADLDPIADYEGLTKPLRDVLLEPTKIYVRSLLDLQENVAVKGLAHITGGGFYENIPRMLPQGLGVTLNPQQWERPAIFSFLQSIGKLTDETMYGVFNMGIGMAVVVAEDEVEPALARLQAQGEAASVIGTVVADEGVRFQS